MEIKIQVSMALFLSSKYIKTMNVLVFNLEANNVFHEFIGGFNTRISPVIDWSRTTLNNVLLEADKMC